MFSGADYADLGVGSHNVPQIDDAPPPAMQKKSKSQRNSSVSFATGSLLPPSKTISLHLTFTSPGLIPCSSSFQKSSLTLQSWIRWACRSPNSIPYAWPLQPCLRSPSCPQFIWRQCHATEIPLIILWMRLLLASFVGAHRRGARVGWGAQKESGQLDFEPQASDGHRRCL